MIRKLSLLLILLGFFACSHKEKKPEKLISQPEMTRIITDVLTAKEIYQQKKNYFDKNDLNPVTAVLKKYGIDSVRYMQSLDYYADHPDIFLRMYKQVENNIKRKRDSLDKLMKNKRKNQKAVEKKKIKHKLPPGFPH